MALQRSGGWPKREARKWIGMMAATAIGCCGLACKAQPPLSPQSTPGSGWDYIATARTGAGYKDNVTLSYVAPESSAFLDSMIEFIASRDFASGAQFSFFGSFEDHHFLAPISVEKEQLGFVQGDLARRFSDRWKAGLALDYLYQDQIMDVSVTETNLSALRVLGHTLIARPKVRWDASPVFWAEVQTPAQRQYLEQPLDDYWETGPRLVLGHNYGHDSEMNVGYEASFRKYDNELALSAEGEPLPGTERAWWYQRIQWTWRHNWDKGRRWRTVTRFSVKENQDHGGGFFDYTAFQFSESARFRSRKWELNGEARLAHYQYDEQTVSPGDPRHRNRRELALVFEAQRKLTWFLKLFARLEREQVYSNVEIEQYTANVVTGGLLWEY